jgi:hypothetical protein
VGHTVKFTAFSHGYGHGRWLSPIPQEAKNEQEKVDENKFEDGALLGG